VLRDGDLLASSPKAASPRRQQLQPFKGGIMKILRVGLTGWGLLRMEINDTYKAFLGVSWLYLITCTFTLAKTLRDRHEADLMDARLQGRAARAMAEAE
jgi:hypothetical protein